MHPLSTPNVHGAAGCSEWGAEQLLWAPAEVGRSYDLSPGSLLPLDPYRDTLTIVSNTDVRMAEAYSAPEIGGDHFRATAAFLTQAHPKLTEGSDVFVGTSFDQLYAQRFGQEPPFGQIRALARLFVCLDERNPCLAQRIQCPAVGPGHVPEKTADQIEAARKDRWGQCLDAHGFTCSQEGGMTRTTLPNWARSSR